MQLGPANDFFVMRVKELPAERRRHAETAIIRCASANPNNAASRPLPRCRLQHLPHAAGIKFERVVLPRRELRQADHLRRFDNRRLGRLMPPPHCGAWTVSRIYGFHRLRLASQTPAEYFAKTVPA